MIEIDTISLKKYIVENNKIEFVLQEIGCHNIKYHPLKNYYTCSNYNGDNPTAINVFNDDYIKVVNWTRSKNFDKASDIITLIEYNKNCSFIEALKFLHKILELEYNGYSKKSEIKVKNPCELFKRIKDSVRGKGFDVNEINYLDEDLLDDFVPLLHINWFKESVMPWSADKFGLSYSYKRKRIIVPLRHWMTGKLLGTNMRTVIPDYAELGIKKFLITSSYPKSLNLFGLYENYESIQKAGYVVIFESEKSVIKRDSLNDSTCVALSGHTISEEQVRILIGLNVDIVVALDKDIPIEEVRDICNKFYGVRNVYYIWDKWNLLSEKDSPADALNKIYQFLIKYKIKFDDKEHKEYLKGLKE